MKKKTYVKKDRPGYTLIEVMVTITIFCILAGIAIPGFSSWLPSYHLKTAARDAFSNMQLARLEAVKQNSTCTVSVDTGAKTYNIDLLNRTISLSEYGNGISFTGPGGETTDSSISFNNRGMSAAGATKYIYITNSKNTAYYRIEINMIGTVMLTRHNGSTWE